MKAKVLLHCLGWFIGLFVLVWVFGGFFILLLPLLQTCCASTDSPEYSGVLHLSRPSVMQKK